MGSTHGVRESSRPMPKKVAKHDEEVAVANEDGELVLLGDEGAGGGWGSAGGGVHRIGAGALRYSAPPAPPLAAPPAWGRAARARAGLRSPPW